MHFNTKKKRKYKRSKKQIKKRKGRESWKANFVNQKLLYVKPLIKIYKMSRDMLEII